MGAPAVAGESEAGVQQPELLQPKGPEHAGPRRGSIQGLIVVYHRDAVGREPNIQLEGIGALLGRSLEGDEGILRRRPRRTAMGDDGPSRQIEQRVHPLMDQKR
jgi:hypothetical protein